MASRIILTFLTTTLLSGCGFAWKTPRPVSPNTGSPPVILSFYADPLIRPGETWRVYLKVRDVDCDMTYVVTDMRRAGGSSYPVGFTPIKGNPCPELEGYVFLRTPADQSLIWDGFEVRVSVRDQRGNSSKTINLSLNFDAVPSTEPPEQWQKPEVASIGSVQIDLADYRRTDTGR